MNESDLSLAAEITHAYQEVDILAKAVRYAPNPKAAGFSLKCNEVFKEAIKVLGKDGHADLAADLQSVATTQAVAIIAIVRER